jgi:hypothetical protein
MRGFVLLVTSNENSKIFQDWQVFPDEIEQQPMENEEMIEYFKPIEFQNSRLRSKISLNYFAFAEQDDR